jgi:hypothetical protein
MEYKFAHLVESVIAVFFPGGIEEFYKKGHITVIPNPAKEIVVYHPDLDPVLIDKLKGLGIKDRESVNVLTEKNFEGIDGNELRTINLKINSNIEKLNPQASILFNDNSNLVVITLPNIKDTDEILELIFASLRNVDGLLIAYVITSTSVFKIEPKRSKQIPSTERKALTDDDVTNIIIAIENAKSIDDLLK